MQDKIYDLLLTGTVICSLGVARYFKVSREKAWRALRKLEKVDNVKFERRIEERLVPSVSFYGNGPISTEARKKLKYENRKYYFIKK